MAHSFPPPGHSPARADCVAACTRALLLLACLVPAGPSGAQADDRYAAWLSDGTVVTAPTLPSWPVPGTSWHLGGRNLLAGEHPLRLLRDRLAVLERRPPYLVMVSGDVLCGRPVRWERDPNGEPGAGRLWIQLEMPLVPLTGTALPIRADRVARLVLDPAAAEEPPLPGRVRLLDGRSWMARAIRWREGGLALLTAEGVTELPLRDLAEVCFLSGDPWQALLEESVWADTPDAVLLTRWQTREGAALTSARVRRQELGAVPRRGMAEETVYVLQPAWALAPLVVPQAAVAAVSLRRPDELPLVALPSRRPAWRVLTAPPPPPYVSPPWAAAPPGTAGSGPWECDLGLPTRAASLLAWELPPLAERLLLAVGLDRSAGRGGCVRCQVWAGRSDALLPEQTDREPKAAGANPVAPLPPRLPDPPDSHPVPLHNHSFKGDESRFERILGGMDCLWDSGIVQGRDGPQRPKPLDLRGRQRLALVTEFAHDERPSGADPLDIRDQVVWLDPRVRLLPDALSLPRRLTSRLTGLDAWQLDGTRWEGVELHTPWHPASQQWDNLLRLPPGGSLTFRRQVTVSPAADVLELLTICPLDLDQHQLVLRVDGVEVPWSNNADRQQLRQWTLRYSRLRASGQEPEGNLTDRLAYWWDLQDWHGRSVALELTLGGPRRSEFLWRSLSLRAAVANLPPGGQLPQPPVPLTHLTPLDEPSGDYNRPLQGFIPSSREGEPIRLLGKWFREGYGMGRNSRLRFPILPHYRRFVAVVGCAQQAVGPVQILIDDQVVWQRPVLSSLWPAELVEIPLPPQARTLTLQTGTSGLYYGFAAFVHAGFFTDEGTPSLLPGEQDRQSPR